MKKDAENDRRIELLRTLIDAKFAGNVNACGRAIGYNDGAFVRQCLSGLRVITEKSVKKFEALPSAEGWFAAQPAAAGDLGALSDDEARMVKAFRQLRAAATTQAVSKPQPSGRAQLRERLNKHRAAELAATKPAKRGAK